MAPLAEPDDAEEPAAVEEAPPATPRGEKGVEEEEEVLQLQELLLQVQVMVVQEEQDRMYLTHYLVQQHRVMEQQVQ